MAKPTNTGIENTMATLDRTTGYYVKKHNGKKIALHRLIINANHGDIVDHINRIKTDNRPENLRFVTKSQNNRNRKAQGYTYKNGKYEVKTTYQNKTYYVGRYDTPEKAQIAYKAVSKFAFEIGGIEYDKNEVEERLKDIKPIKEQK